MRECWSFASCAAGNQEINSRLNLPGNQISERRLVQRSILMKWCDEGRTASTKLHENKIARMDEDGKRPMQVRSADGTTKMLNLLADHLVFWFPDLRLKSTPLFFFRLRVQPRTRLRCSLVFVCETG